MSLLGRGFPDLLSHCGGDDRRSCPADPSVNPGVTGTHHTKQSHLMWCTKCDLKIHLGGWDNKIQRMFGTTAQASLPWDHHAVARYIVNWQVCAGNSSLAGRRNPSFVTLGGCYGVNTLDLISSCWRGGPEHRVGTKGTESAPTSQ